MKALTALDNFPPELLTEIVAAVSTDSKKTTNGAADYTDLLTFSRLSRKFSQAGQEVLFKHYDLTKNPTLQLYRLLRTLLLSPKKDDLRRKIQTIAISLLRREEGTPGFFRPKYVNVFRNAAKLEPLAFREIIKVRGAAVRHAEQTNKDVDLRLSLKDRLLRRNSVSGMKLLLSLAVNCGAEKRSEKTDRAKTFRVDWTKRLLGGDFLACMAALLSLAPNLKKLEI
jgi:hypothetical protein